MSAFMNTKARTRFSRSVAERNFAFFRTPMEHPPTDGF
jgi:hypothetical protein